MVSRQIPILVYHQVLSEERQVERFQEQMEFLAFRGYTCLSLGEYEEYLDGKRNPPPGLLC